MKKRKREEGKGEIRNRTDEEKGARRENEKQRGKRGEREEKGKRRKTEGEGKVDKEREALIAHVRACICGPKPDGIASE